MDHISLEGQTAIVTGAGRGIGRAHALELGGRGAAVVVNDVDADLADEVADLVRAGGSRAEANHDSVADQVGAEAIVAAAVHHFGSVEILVNNAGVLRTGYFEDLTDEQIDVVLATHLRAAFSITRPAWRVMKEQRYGRIIMTSSSSGMFSHQGLSNYAAAKAGLYGLTKALSFEGKRWGINVNAILPMALSISPAKDPIPDMASYFEQFVPNREAVSAGRNDPATVAALVAYLVSRQCETSGEAYSLVNGRFARVFVAVSHGWLADDPAGVDAEAIADHFDEIRDLSTDWTVPMWLFEEVRDVAERLSRMPA
jgi:NAD(P)-dependent dehydrogenase (short-subunit alcohol dehydrogenase family)